MPSVVVNHWAYRNNVVRWSHGLGRDNITGTTEVFGHRLEVRRVDRSKITGALALAIRDFLGFIPLGSEDALFPL